MSVCSTKQSYDFSTRYLLQAGDEACFVAIAVLPCGGLVTNQNKFQKRNKNTENMREEKDEKCNINGKQIMACSALPIIYCKNFGE